MGVGAHPPVEGQFINRPPWRRNQPLVGIAYNLGEYAFFNSADYLTVYRVYY
jgi:hypothetical protein